MNIRIIMKWAGRISFLLSAIFFVISLRVDAVSPDSATPTAVLAFIGVTLGIILTSAGMPEKTLSEREKIEREIEERR